MLTEKNLLLLRLSKVPRIGPAQLHKWSSDPDLIDKGLDGLMQDARIRGLLKSMPGGWEHALELADRDLAALERSNGVLLAPDNPAFPPLLQGVPKAPYFLYVKGALEALGDRAFTVIGTRQPTVHGTAIAERIARYFADRGWTIVSGLALGCDALAHRATLAEHGKTVAVMAHGLHTVAPRQNQVLAETILAGGGALVSAYPFGTEPMPALFAARDYLQAALGRGVVMVQSDLEGGSLHACRAAIELGRVLAFPVPTQQDRMDHAPKIRANLMLEHRDPLEITTLLKLKPGQIKADALFPIAGREAYQALEARLLALETSQGALFN